MKGKVVEYRKDDIIMFLTQTEIDLPMWGAPIRVPSETEAKVVANSKDWVAIEFCQTPDMPTLLLGREFYIANGTHICLSAATMALNEQQKYVHAEKRPPTLLVFDRWMYAALHLVLREHGGFGEKLFGCYWTAVDNPEFPRRVYAVDLSRNYGPIYTNQPPFLSQSPGTY